MNNNAGQALLWQFISAYKRYSGEQLSYVQLAQNDSLLERHLRIAEQTGNTELRNVARALADHLRTAISDTNHRRARPNSARSLSAQETSADSEPSVEEEYTALVREVLAHEPMVVDKRLELDRFCRRNRLESSIAIDVENREREALGLPPLNWRHELRTSIEALAANGGLTERDRLKFFEAYLKKGRLSMLHAEQIISESSAAQPSMPTVPRRQAPRLFVLGSFMAALALGLLWGYSARESTVPAAVAAEDSPAPKDVHVSGSILESTLWKQGTTYHLDGVTYVESGATLTIEPGVHIKGSFGSALVVTRNASIYARGTAESPIVFTSTKAVGKRQRGDWGGVVLLGNAPVNQKDAHIEGLPAEDVRGRFGGQAAGASCGVLEYVRIEFAGFEVFANNELNGLTLGGCGHRTIVRHVQVHKALDDGIEVFGGDVDLRNVLVTGAGDDSFDWDMGWTGRVQFAVIQQHGDDGDNGFEADNWGKDHDAQPRSRPTFYNVTMIGSRNPEMAQRAMTLRRGTAGAFHNFIIAGFPLEAVDIRDATTASLTETGDLVFSHGLLHDIGKDGTGYFGPETNNDDDDGFDETRYFSDTARAITFGADPMLPMAAFDPLTPDFVPDGTSPAAKQAAPIPKEEFFDEAANYLGAIRPGSLRNWLHGWTAYPAN